MEPDRFDDVESRILEQPELSPPRRPRRVRRWALGLGATLVTAGALAAGASALTGSGDEPAAAPPAGKKAGADVTYNADGVPMKRSGHECRSGKGFGSHDRSDASDAAKLRY